MSGKIGKKDLETIKRRKLAEKKNWIKVGMSTCGIAAGADKVLKVLKEQALKRNLNVSIEQCGCLGMCYAEPLVEVAVEGLPQVTYGGVNEKDAETIIERHVCNKRLLQDRIYKVKVK